MTTTTTNTAAWNAAVKARSAYESAQDDVDAADVPTVAQRQRVYDLHCKWQDAVRAL